MQKKIAAVQDISGFGRCSLTTAIAVLSACGHQCCPVPSAVLSAHTAYEGITYRDLTEDLPAYVRTFETLGLRFNAIYSGYLSSGVQIGQVIRLAENCAADDCMVLVDPVMGDNGKLYQKFSLEFPSKMRELCKVADVITPNVTEACLLLGEPFQEPPYTKEYMQDLLLRLSKMFGCTVVLTGACERLDMLGAAAYQPSEKQFFFAFDKRVEGMFHGTGDVFTAVLVAALTQGEPLGQAIQTAVKFTCLSIEKTLPYRKENWYGVHFEEVLPLLPSLLKGEEVDG